MIIQVFSDIHLEYMKSIPKFDPCCEVLILAGDIGQLHLPSYKIFMDYVSNNWEKVFCVLGNHEYYNSKKSYNQLRKDYNKFFDRYDNISLLDQKKEIYKGITFMGCTLWGNYPSECSRDYVNCLNNIYSFQNNSLKPISKDFFNELNQKEKTWIYDNLDNENTVLITHYPTVINGTSSPKWKDEKYKTIFANNLDFKNINNLVSISGHTHFCYDFIDNDTGIRHIGNHMGYKDEIDSGEIKFNPTGLCRL